MTTKTLSRRELVGDVLRKHNVRFATVIADAIVAALAADPGEAKPFMDSRDEQHFQGDGIEYIRRRAAKHETAYANPKQAAYLRSLADDLERRLSHPGEAPGNWRALLSAALAGVDYERAKESLANLAGTVQAFLAAPPGEALREPVRWFAGQMEARLREHDGREGWEDCGSAFLLQRLHECARNIADALSNGSLQLAIKESADTANFAMMVADNQRALLPEPPRPAPEPADPDREAERNSETGETRYVCRECGKVFDEYHFSHGRWDDDDRGNLIEVECGPVVEDRGGGSGSVHE